MNFKRNYFFIFTFLIFVLSCGSYFNSPEKRAKKFFYLLDGGKIDAASQMLSKSSMKFGKKKVRYILESISNNIQSHKGLKSVKVTEKGMKGNDKCNLTLKIIFGDDYRTLQDIKMVKENDKWKINLSSLIF